MTAKAVTVLRALQRMWDLVAKDRWIIFAAFSVLVFAAVRVSFLVHGYSTVIRTLYHLWEREEVVRLIRFNNLFPSHCRDLQIRRESSKAKLHQK